MTTVPAHNFSAPARAWVMAAARFMPGVWAVLMSSSLARTTHPEAVEPPSGVAAFVHGYFSATCFRASAARSSAGFVAIYRERARSDSARVASCGSDGLGRLAMAHAPP